MASTTATASDGNRPAGGTATILYVGGASASGKTTVARRLGSVLKLPVLSLDALYNLATPAIRDGDRLESATKRICRSFIEELLLGGARCVAEGGWLDPADAAALRAQHGLVPLYCGYAETTPAERLRLLRAPGAEPHWLAAHPDARALAKLELQIANSRWYRDRCAELGLPYFDCGRFDDGADALCRHVAALQMARR